MQERRQNVRVRPVPDYNIAVDYGSGLVKVQLQVIDAAVGGFALTLIEQLVELTAGDAVKLGIALPGAPRFETVGTLRYTTGKVGGRCGVHLNALDDAQQTALSRTVSELLERGFST